MSAGTKSGWDRRSDLRDVFGAVVDEYLSGPHDASFVHRGLHLAPHRFVAVVGTILEHFPDGGTFIDIGAGDGIVPRMLQKVGAGRVIVIDSAEAGSGSLDILAALGIETVSATVGAQPVPLPEGTADLIFAGDVIEHLPHSPRPFMLEIKRILKPGGWHVQDTPNAVCLRTRLKMLAGFSNWTTLDGIYWPDQNLYHHKEYTLTELVNLFTLSGFEEVSGRTYEQFWQRSLKQRGVLTTMGVDYGATSKFGSGFNYRHPYEYARMACWATTSAVPSLKTSLVAAGRKPR